MTKKHFSWALTVGVLVLLAIVFKPKVVSHNVDVVRPIDSFNTIWIEEMTWMEVRDAIKAGSTTALIGAGGIEQNGPFVALGKHNYILNATLPLIAAELGQTLIAPVVKFVPEGDISPPSGHMQYAGTISVSEATFQSLLKDTARSLIAHGFTQIILIGDSGGNQAGMGAVADELNDEWGASARAIFVPEYYNYAELPAWLTKHYDITQTAETIHDDIFFTAQLMTIDPNLVRMAARRKAGEFRINGIELDPADKTIEIGNKIIQFRVDATVAAIRQRRADLK